MSQFYFAFKILLSSCVLLQHIIELLHRKKNTTVVNVFVLKVCAAATQLFSHSLSGLLSKNHFIYTLCYALLESSLYSRLTGLE